MNPARFFVPPGSIQGNLVSLPSDTAHQISRVLRLRAGDRIVVLDNSGLEYTVALKNVSPSAVEGVVEERSLCTREPRARLALYQGVLKGEKFEMVLQKGTELGISSFVPIFCHRSVPREGQGWPGAKYPRWRRIVVEAAEQCGRGLVPSLEPPMAFAHACDEAHGLRLIPWEGEDAVSLKDAVRRRERPSGGELAIGIFIGPEGGFTSEEVDYARSRGIVSVSLGPRILRAETAALVATTTILYELGEMDRQG